MRIFPTSPAPADMSRRFTWGDNVQRFDSGARQAVSPFSKPLTQYSFRLENVPRSKQSSLEAFYNGGRGRVTPFLFEDPYDRYINGVPCVRSGTGVRSFMVVNSSGWAYIPVSGTVLITSTLSGALTQGTHYSFSSSTGIFSTHIAPASADTWTASCRFFRKCAFNGYMESSRLWEMFSGEVTFSEIALP